MLSDVVGQDAALPFLRRVADGTFTCPLLIEGEEGTGRRFAATQAVKEALCSGTKSAGCKCFDCGQIDRGTHPDVKVVVPEGDRDIGIDAIRDVVSEAQVFPSVASLRFFIIDGADRFTTGAANAILKTLEEPPQTSRFILLAERYNAVIPTIRSRCGRVRFQRLSEDVIVSMLSQHESDPGKALVHARIADGSIGRALRNWGAGRLLLRDQVLSLLELGLVGDLSSLFVKIDAFGQGLPVCLSFLEQLLHDLLVMQHDRSRVIHLDVVDRLDDVHKKISRGAITRLVMGLRTIRARAHASKINVAFHLKTLFVNTFFVTN